MPGTPNGCRARDVLRVVDERAPRRGHAKDAGERGGEQGGSAGERNAGLADGARGGQAEGAERRLIGEKKPPGSLTVVDAVVSWSGLTMSCPTYVLLCGGHSLVVSCAPTPVHAAPAFWPAEHMPFMQRGQGSVWSLVR